MTDPVPHERMVREIDALDLEGFVVPPSWLRRLRTGRGEPEADTDAALLLAAVLSRCKYPSAPARWDDTWGLRTSYSELAAPFSFTKRQTTRAMRRLHDAGVVELWIRHYSTMDVQDRHAKVLYVKPVIEEIWEISYGTRNRFSHWTITTA